MRPIDADALLEELEKMRFPSAPYVDAGVEIAIGKVCEAPDIEAERSDHSGMSDPIDRQAAIDAIDEIESEVADGYGYQYEKWRKYFRELPSAQPEQQWIPVSSKLPEYGESVLCYFGKDEDFGLNHVIDEEAGEWFFNGVTAWMPLPEPPKEGGAE